MVAVCKHNINFAFKHNSIAKNLITEKAGEIKSVHTFSPAASWS